MIDSHAHIFHRRYREEGAEVSAAALVERAKVAGIREIVAIACELEEWRETVDFAEATRGVWVAAGVHPGSADDAAVLPTVAELADLARFLCVIGLGETGLDARPGEVPSARQVELFVRHLEAARLAKLPVCLHTRGAEDQVLEMLRDYGDVGFVYHCFTGTAEQARRVVEAGGYVSLSGIVTFGNAKELQAVAKTIPLERLLLETDAPYLAPVPQRGQRNEPALVAHTYNFVAELLQVPLPELVTQVAGNFRRLFPRATMAHVEG